MKCSYCDQPLTDNEWDDESQGYFSAHSRCVQPATDGPWYVRTVQNAATPARESVTHYTTQKRAREQALYLRQWNQRSWPCGAQLDIFVGSR